ncbi:hypothetical protein CspHIS471_0503920 [Cutaneotrichosporon sp. HIS471]|nr:hypothetical protein CspHIS471_0503920 [Cutaneotrichosporon sp. HIS471]
MKWNIGFGSSSDSAPAMPVDHPPVPTGAGAAQCPIDHASLSPEMIAAHKARAEAEKVKAAQCPIDHASMSPEEIAALRARTQQKNEGGGMMGALGASVGAPNALNPINHIPEGLSATERAPGQQIDLSTERTMSTIPRPQTKEDVYGGGEDKVWAYPSPQQFYNALVRKGWETPEDSIDMIVDIHNFINEGAWDEIMKWEQRRPGGEHAQLAKFQGRPHDLTPRARWQLFMAKLFPNDYSSEPPFDRHDWIVTRPILDAEGNKTKEEASTRYVIDYYSVPSTEGEAVFSLEVRPALDSFADASERVKMAAQEWMQSRS